MAERPNVLFLMSDHTNSQAIAPGSQCVKPNLDALSADGVRFDRCYTTNAICSPSRASLMTGLYPSTHGMWDVTHGQRSEWVDVPADRFAYFSMNLAEAGYRNAYFGKWHVEQSERLEDFGWHEYDVTCGRMYGPEWQPGLVESSELYVPKEGYRDYLLAAVSDADGPDHPAFDKGIDFIRRHAATAPEQPFCCFVSVIEPHDAYVPPRDFMALYDVDGVELSPTLRDEPTGKPEIVRRMRSVWQDMSDDDWRKTAASYWAVISYVDAQVGRIVDALKETGQYDNTIIVFTSDHGDMMGGHGLCTKGIGTPYEEVYNIPLIIRAPGTSTGREDADTLTSLVDVGPTLLDLCGAEPLADAQGRSLRPVLEDAADPSERRGAYAEFYGQRFVYTQRITWDGDWKYVFSPGGVDELYDLASDPHERNNLAEDPAHRERLLEMVKTMWRKMREIGDDSLFNSHYATLRTAPVGPWAIDE